jgi:hypothetical protein
MATLNITNIPAPRVPFIDERTGLMAREWYRFFLNLFVLTGSGNNPITLEELQLGPPSQPDLAELLIQVNQNIAPQYEDQSGDFLATLDTAQLMSMMARFENLEAAIQGAYLDPPSIPTDGVYVPYNNATTNVDLNNKHIVNVAHIGVGTSSTPDTLILAVGDNGSLSRIVMRGYSANASSSSMRVSKYRGTVAAPQVPQSGDSLGQFQFAGYTTTSADGSAGAYWEGVTTETWGATANGTKVLLKVTPNTTTTPVTAVTVDQDKSVTFATTASATTFIGALTGTASGNLVNGGALGTPSSGTVTNLTGTASININGTVGATTATTGKFTTIEGTDTTDATSTTAAAVKTAGGLAVAKKVYTGDNVVPAAAKGVNFTGNTPAAGMTSQLLNWYEEGTWTPSTRTAGGTYTAQVGTYVRVGKLVTCFANIAWSAHTGAGADLEIQGFPFTNGSAGTYPPGTFAGNLILTAGHSISSYILPSTSYIKVLDHTDLTGTDASYTIPASANITVWFSYISA